MIRSSSDPRWLEVALANFDRVIVDHAHCEKKAAAQALSLVGSYPDRDRLVRRLSALAIEELRHFRQVHARLRKRGLALGPDRGDPYARALFAHVRRGGEERLLDRLLVAGLIESRSHEKLALLAGGLEEAELADFYRTLALAEAGHSKLFEDLALSVPRGLASDEVDRRAVELAGIEAGIVAALPLEPRVH